MSDIKIITVRWIDERAEYKVSEPNWSGGEVVMWRDVQAILAAQAADIVRLNSLITELRGIRAVECKATRERLSDARALVQDCIDTGFFDRACLGNLYSARDAIDLAKEGR